MIPLSDASRRPRRFPVVTTAIIVLNALVFLLELTGGEEFVKQWSVVPVDILAGRHWVTLVTAMFMHAGWLHILGNIGLWFLSQLFSQVGAVAAGMYSRAASRIWLTWAVSSLVRLPPDSFRASGASPKWKHNRVVQHY